MLFLAGASNGIHKNFQLLAELLQTTVARKAPKAVKAAVRAPVIKHPAHAGFARQSETEGQQCLRHQEEDEEQVEEQVAQTFRRSDASVYLPSWCRALDEAYVRAWEPLASRAPAFAWFPGIM